MSLFHSAQVQCGHCAQQTSVSWAASVNADRRPDLRDAILDNSFQAVDCEGCGQPVRVPPHLTYVDMARKEWILVEDPRELGSWASHEASAEAVFDQTFGERAPRLAQELAEGVKVRLVFGWPALREKLLLTESGLDDEVVELAKLAVLRSALGAPLAGSQTMRVVAVTDDHLKVAVTDDLTEAVSATTSIPRAVYSGIEGELGAWSALRDQWAGRAFVDTARLLVAG